MTLHAALRTLGWLAGTLFPQQAMRALQGRDFNAALGRVDALMVAEERSEVLEPGELSGDWGACQCICVTCLSGGHCDTASCAQIPDDDPSQHLLSVDGLIVNCSCGRWFSTDYAARKHIESLASDFPACNCPARQAADLGDHRPACAARAADSPAVDASVWPAEYGGVE